MSDTPMTSVGFVLYVNRNLGVQRIYHFVSLALAQETLLNIFEHELHTDQDGFAYEATQELDIAGIQADIDHARTLIGTESFMLVANKLREFWTFVRNTILFCMESDVVDRPRKGAELDALANAIPGKVTS